MLGLNASQWICVAAGTAQIALLLYLFFSVRIDTQWYYVSDALRYMLYVRVTLTATVLIQTLVAMIFMTGLGMAWAMSGVLCGSGIAFGWVILVTWNETTTPHLYGVGIFLISISAFFTVELVRRGIYLWDDRSHVDVNINKMETKKRQRFKTPRLDLQIVWFVCAALYLCFGATILTFIALQFGTADPTLYEWISFMVGEVLFMLITVTVE